MERISHQVSDDGGTGREEEHLMVGLESLSDIPGDGEKGIDPAVVIFCHEKRIPLLDLFNHLEGRFLIDSYIHFRDKVLGIFLFPDFPEKVHRLFDKIPYLLIIFGRIFRRLEKDHYVVPFRHRLVNLGISRTLRVTGEEL